MNFSVFQRFMLTYISCAHTCIFDKKYICLVIYITVTKCEFSLKDV